MIESIMNEKEMRYWLDSNRTTDFNLIQNIKQET